ncbi:hypothetical protein HZF10_17585 [Flavobacterium sp. MAH-1]|uniref:RHS repeat-associated core domain-containing protein n=1 Tax=Flavobacterium agri TaxID=2743471 RepID=A0A7Y8Y522_9FLAO|nr:hypothetical protein [Flavobacterium agri]
MHDPRVGRFFAVDPLTKEYPHYTPYSFSGNKVISAIELEGLEESELFHRTSVDGAYGIFSDGFNSKFTQNAEFHFFSMTKSSSGAGASVAKAPIQLKVKLDITTAKEISYKQYSGWFKEALGELNYNGPKNLPKEIQSKADAIRNQKLWDYMKSDGGEIYKINNGKFNFIAANDDALKGAEVAVVEGKSILGKSLKFRVGELTGYGTKITPVLPKVFKVLAVAAEIYTAYEAAMEFADLLNALGNTKSDAAKEYWREARRSATTLGHYNTGITPVNQKQAEKDEIESATFQSTQN